MEVPNCFGKIDELIIRKKISGTGDSDYSIDSVRIAEKGNEIYAIKIMKKNHPKFDEKFMKFLEKEADINSKLDHPNIVKFFETKKESILEKRNGVKVPVIYILQELVPSGDLFDYLSMTGQFSEAIARYYFLQLINSLYYLHNVGYVHRNIKGEHLLFDSNYNLKLSGFGYGGPIKGRNNKGFLNTFCGTISYMPPEIHLRLPYDGSKSDIFSSGVILFIMVMGHPPFVKTTITDPYYSRFIYHIDKFWEFHTKGLKFQITNEFKDVISKLLSFHPEDRPSLNEILSHQWMKGIIPTSEEIKQEFSRRHETIIKKKNELTLTKNSKKKEKNINENPESKEIKKEEKIEEIKKDTQKI